MGAKYPYVVPCFGIHPWYVTETSPQWFETLKSLFETTPTAAIGEVSVFRQQLELANELNKPPSIHCVRAFGDLLEIIKFGRDGSMLTRKITRIVINKFTGAFYTWKCVPRERQERYFLEFAKTHHWDPFFSEIVQQHFETIASKRLKDMVSTCRRTRVRPKWIKNTLWTEMCSYWDTDVALKRSRTASRARKSNRKGLGEYKHYTGQKSYAQIQQEMEAKFNRPVSIGEVFLFIHTRPDGKFADLKAERIAKTYKELVQAKQSELGADTSEGMSQRELNNEEHDELFLQTTEKDSRGTPYGVGNIDTTHVLGKRKFRGGSSFQAFQDQLAETQKKLEDQAKTHALREAELIKLAAEQQSKFKQLSVMEKFMSLNPRYLDFLSTLDDGTPTDPPNIT